MPELPEVETLKRQLEQKIIGKIIEDVKVQLPKLVFFNGKKGDTVAFKKTLINSKINNIQRRAKILIFYLSNDYSLLIHLKMTGQLIYRQKGKIDTFGGHAWPTYANPTPNKWTHIIIYFTDGSILYFNDLRQFGYMKLVNTSKLLEQKELYQLGIEPFKPNFSVKKLELMLAKRPKMKIKQLLMDQTFISGIGNIYADESLFYAGVLPTRPASQLKKQEIKKLHTGIKSILQKAITKGGTSANTYVMLSGEKGGFAPYLKVYGKEGMPCLKCGQKIQRIKLGGRSAHFCPKCQK